MAAAHPNTELATLCELLEDSYSYPVDSLVVRGDLRVLGQVPVSRSVSSGPLAYVDWLRESLGSEPDAGLEHLRLAPESKTASLRMAIGEDPLEIEVDTELLPEDSTLEVELCMGDGEAEGTLRVLPGHSAPALAESGPVAPGESKVLTVGTQRGRPLVLRVIGSRGVAFGRTNDFRVQVRAMP